MKSLKKVAKAPKSKPAARPKNAPAALSSTMTRQISLSHRLRDKDLLYNVTSDLSKTAGASIRIPCNPRLWPNTRAKQESLGWQTYYPNSIVIKVSPAVATTSAGQVIGGSLTTEHNVDGSYITNALMAIPGSYASAVWEKGMVKMDLSSLTQTKFHLNQVDQTGTPVCAYLVLPSAFRGLIEVIYDISFYGHTTSDTDIPIYDLIPRVFTSGGADKTLLTVSPTTGLATGNFYDLEFSGNLTTATTLQDSAADNLMNTSYMNSLADFVYFGASSKAYERDTQLETPAVGQVFDAWLRGRTY